MTRALLSALSLAAFVGVAPATAQLSVDESAIAADVQDRAPVGVDTAFGADVGRVFCFTRISGADAEETLHHVWIYNGEEVADVALNIGGSPWRTWSSKTIPDWATGEWTVEIRNSEGAVLQTLTFTVS